MLINHTGNGIEMEIGTKYQDIINKIIYFFMKSSFSNINLIGFFDLIMICSPYKIRRVCKYRGLRLKINYLVFIKIFLDGKSHVIKIIKQFFIHGNKGHIQVISQIDKLTVICGTTAVF